MLIEPPGEPPVEPPVEPPGARRAPSPPRRPPASTRLWLLIAVAVLWSAWRALATGQPLVNPGGWPQLVAFLRAALQPEWSPDFLALTVRAAWTTLAFAVCGASLSLVIGVVGGLLASEVWWRLRGRVPVHGADGSAHGRRAVRWPGHAARLTLGVPRAIHEVIWGLILVNVLGLDPLVAVLAIAIPFGAITAKVFAEILDETPRGPCQALVAAGASPLTAVAYGLLPLALPNLVSYTFYRVECSIRSAAVLGVVGAGGLGTELLLSFQSLKFREMWTLLYALIVLSGLVDGWSALVRRHLGGASRIGLAVRDGLPVASGSTPQRHRQGRRDPVVLASAAAWLVLIPTCFWALHIDPRRLWAPRTVRLAGELARDAWPPDLAPALLTTLARQSVDTVAMSILAIAIAAGGGVVLAFLAARTFTDSPNVLESAAPPWPVPWLRLATQWLARLGLLVCRAIPASVWALLALFVLFPGVLPGAVALGIYTLGVLGRLMAEVVEGLDPRPLRALGTLGATPAQAFGYGALPQSLPGFLSYSLYRWEVCSRETVIVGVVGAAGLGRVLTEQLSSFDHDGVMTTLLCFVALTWGVDEVGARARRVVRVR